MATVAELLDLLPSDKEVADKLHASEEMVRRWRVARAVPENKAKDLIELALMRGHLEEVSRIASTTAPYYLDIAGLLHNLGKPQRTVQDKIGATQRTDDLSIDAIDAIGPDLPITRILEDMQEHRVFSGDPIARVRALRAEWDWRSELHDRIRAGDDD